MRKIFLTLTLILFMVSQVHAFDPLLIFSGMPAAGGAPTYLIQEEAEGASTPSGWSDTGTVTWNYATDPAPLAGSKSVIVSGAGNYYTTTATFAVQSEYWARFIVHHSATPSSDLSFFTGGLELIMRSSSADIRIRHGSEYSISYDATAGTVYYIWVHCKTTDSGGGVDGEVWISLNGTKPATPTLSISNGGWSGTITTVLLRARYSCNSIFDSLTISDSDNLGDF